MSIFQTDRPPPPALVAEPLLEAGARHAGVELLGERLGLLDELLAHRRIEPGLQVGLVVEAQDGDEVLLDAGHRRLEAIALQAGRLGLGGGDLALPGAVLGLLARLHARADHGRDRRGLAAAFVVADDVHVVAADQERRRALDAGLALGRGQPALRVLHGVEALQDDPVDLQRRIGRHQPLLDEAREARDDVARLALPACEVLGSLGPHAGLGDDADGHLALPSLR